MPTLHWWDVPAPARESVADTAGHVLAATSATTGNNSTVAAVLRLEDGHEVFCKGAPLESPDLWAYRNEARLNPHLPGIAPRLLWQTEAAGWLLLGFERDPGRAADLAPGSPDLPRLAAKLAAVARRFTPAPEIPLQPLSRRWALTYWRDSMARPGTGAELPGTVARTELARLESLTPELVAGDTLQHTDMTPHNLLVGEDVHLTDWAWPARTAPWVDAALLVHRLIAAGHAPRAAEEWAARLPAWKTASGEALSAVAVTLWGLWERRLRTDPAPYRATLATAARDWAAHRLT